MGISVHCVGVCMSVCVCVYVWMSASWSVTMFGIFCPTDCFLISHQEIGADIRVLSVKGQSHNNLADENIHQLYGMHLAALWSHTQISMCLLFLYRSPSRFYELFSYCCSNMHGW